MDVRQKADGNPFFLEEILQRLIDEGALVREEGRWVATERATDYPSARHDPCFAGGAHRLFADGRKTLLQQAAVVGRIFWPGSLGAATNGREPMATLALV